VALVPHKCRNCQIEYDLFQHEACPDCGWRDPDRKKSIEIHRDEAYLPELHQQWEYRALVQPFNNINMDEINRLGQVGWELIDVITSTKTSGWLYLVGFEGYTKTDALVFFFKRNCSVEGGER